MTTTQWWVRARRRLRMAILMRPRVTLPAVLGVVGLSFAVVLFALSRLFSVSCPADSPCVTLDELRDGAALPEALRIYDRRGQLLAEVAGPRRRALPDSAIPELLADAFVAVEDQRFRSHEGVEEGASTIPMQLVRTLWAESLREVGPWRRKVIEARTAPRLIEELGHEKVLELYLNAIYLGNGVYGVERAARYYFGVGVEELTVGQVATLVGMTRSPEYYEPRRHPERAVAVRGVVIDLLTAEGLIDSVDARVASTEDLGVVPLDSIRERALERTHLTAAVTRELRRVTPEIASRPGLALHTTIDRTVQLAAEEALSSQLADIESGRYGDLVEPAGSTARLEGAAVALDSRSGAVLAWVGGRDFTRSEFDRVEQAERQVGSLVKPFLVALALERGYGVVDPISADTVPIATEEGAWIPADHVPETPSFDRRPPHFLASSAWKTHHAHSTQK